MKSIITISREFGSGGHTVGKLVAEKLGYHFYGRELVEMVAAASGFSPDFIEESGEYASARSSLLFSLATAGQYETGGMSMHDRLYLVQTQVIEDIAAEGNCVIVGRCADFILRDYKECLHVFVYADMESRARRIVERYGETDKSPKKRLEEKDQKRKVYYKNYTGRNWGEPHNYNLCLDSSKLGIETCADLIVAACK